jgi:hypothetical protein
LAEAGYKKAFAEIFTAIPLGLKRIQVDFLEAEICSRRGNSHA